MKATAVLSLVAVSVQAISQSDFLNQVTAALRTVPACAQSCAAAPSTDPLVFITNACKNPSAFAAQIDKCVANACDSTTPNLGSGFSGSLQGLCDTFATVTPDQPSQSSAVSSVAPNSSPAPSPTTSASPVVSPRTSSSAAVQTTSTTTVQVLSTTASSTAAQTTSTAGLESMTAESIAAEKPLETTTGVALISTTTVTKVATTIHDISTPGNGCTTSSGAAISIIDPQANSIISIGQPLKITWSVVGTPDASFNAAAITFEIANAANPSNVVAVSGGTLSFAQSPHVSDLSASTTVPRIANGNLYTIRSTFKDGSVNRYCFSPTFK
ncbi:UNVERIFIED_CONTAM: hypothetical protein HDU68_003913, partial [Siphonaria sp. JEL0065]